MEYVDHFAPHDSTKQSVMTEPSQPGLEVGADPYATPQSGWPQESKPAWVSDPSEFSPTGKEKSSRKILGLSVGTFWGIVVLICVLLAGGIGGGVGAGLASRKTSCPSQTSISPVPGNAQATSSTGSQTATAGSQTGTGTPTSATSSSTISTSATGSVSPAPSTRCQTETGYNGTSIVPLDAGGNPIPLGSTVQQTFKVFCNTNWAGGPPNPGLHDIMKMYQPDLPHCVAACAEYNAAYSNNAAAGVAVGGGYCKAVALVLAPGEYCYLKNGTGVNDTSTSGGARIDSAMLE